MVPTIVAELTLNNVVLTYIPQTTYGSAKQRRLWKKGNLQME